MRGAIAFATGIGLLSTAKADILKSTYSGSSGLNDLAKESGRYMGTAVDQDLKDSAALKVLKNIGDFGMITPGNSMKVCSGNPRLRSLYQGH
ncbi:unnamed protein product [Phytophthora lilii]|uniref:Unnamed protein product n=1 Tax=Phytophthora lilii TaxID=2077276 RepID=A0A9W6THM7_9STRA|nr:unnamed protein product [Phytophthora lilii]